MSVDSPLYQLTRHLAALSPTEPLVSISDAIWLALHLPHRSEDGTSETTPIEAPKQLETPSPQRPQQIPEGPAVPSGPAMKAPDTRDDKTSQEPRSLPSESPLKIQPLSIPELRAFPYLTLPDTEKTGTPVSGEKVRVASPPSISEPRLISKALQVLARRKKAPHPSVIDLAETVEAFCAGEPRIVFEQEYQRTIELTILLDDAPGMAPWHVMREELLEIFADSRSIVSQRTYAWHVEQEGNTTRHTFHPHQAIGAAKTLRADELALGHARDQVILLFSDCVAGRWRLRSTYQTLYDLSNRAQLLLLHPLPKPMWRRTGLGDAWAIRLHPPSGSEPTTSNISFRNRYMEDHDKTSTALLRLPVLSPTRNDLGHWANFYAGRRDTCPGYAFTVSDYPEQSEEAPNSDAPQETLPSRHESDLRGFWRSAPPSTRRLAQLAAALPVISLPLLRMLRANQLGDTEYHAEVELLLSGLLKPAQTQWRQLHPENIIYHYPEEVHSIFLESLEEQDIHTVLQQVTNLLKQNTGRDTVTGSFYALLVKPRSSQDTPLFYGCAQCFFQATERILARLSGYYRKRWCKEIEPQFLTDINSLLEQAETARQDKQFQQAGTLIQQAQQEARQHQGEFKSIGAWPLVDETLRFYQAASTILADLPFVKPVTEPLSGMVLLPVMAGAFKMGSPGKEPERGSNERQHRVVVSRPFWVGKYPVTQAQYQAVMKDNPSRFKGEDRPVEQVSWEDATAFCAALTESARQEGSIPKGYEYRLPTEAQWEYCCRAGTGSATAFGDSLDSTQANFDGNYPYGKARKGKYLEQTSDVGQYAPNAWGLYDMHGNVWEWCLDHAEWKDGVTTDTYVDDVTDPVCTEGSQRVFRGGSWLSRGRRCRSAYRYASPPDYRDSDLGFRACLAPSPTGQEKKQVKQTGRGEGESAERRSRGR